jgi:cation:H+ antiporter
MMATNLFNVFILYLDDLFYAEGHLFKDTSEVNLLSVFFVIMMTGVAVIGFILPGKEKRLIKASDTLIIFVLYLINRSLLYSLSK